jgi:hypothetical protein
VVRAGQVAEVDGYDNLILLCRKDHKRLDDQVEHFTAERLAAIKVGHEAWVQTHDDGMGLPGCIPSLPGSAAAFAGISSEALICAAVIMALALVAMAAIIHHALTA